VQSTTIGGLILGVSGDFADQGIESIGLMEFMVTTSVILSSPRIPTTVADWCLPGIKLRIGKEPIYADKQNDEVDPNGEMGVSER
jgi:hypothetical protein